MKKAYGLVADQIRDAGGRGSVLKRTHEGALRRPVETVAGARGLDNWKPPSQKSPADFRKETKEAGNFSSLSGSGENNQ